MALFAQLHDICFWGQGGYDFETVYNLPLWLKNFIFSQIYYKILYKIFLI